jgi:hypothetical protein
MIQQAFGLQEAARDAINYPSVKMSALTIRNGYQNMTQEEMESALLALVTDAIVASSYTTTMVLLSEEEQNELASTIDELNELGNN